MHGLTLLDCIYPGSVESCSYRACATLGLHVNDRFHAWQSSLLFTAIFVLHLLFSWSTFLGWVIFLGDLALMAFMALKAYRDADTLDRYVFVCLKVNSSPLTSALGTKFPFLVSWRASLWMTNEMVDNLSTNASLLLSGES